MGTRVGSLDIDTFAKCTDVIITAGGSRCTPPYAGWETWSADSQALIYDYMCCVECLEDGKHGMQWGSQAMGCDFV